MKKILFFIIITLLISNCSLKKVQKHHGVPNLEKKQKNLLIGETNKNDIRKTLGPPSTTSKFDNDIWIYIERIQTQSNIKKLGNMYVYKNDVLVLEIDNYGILKNKNFYNIDDINSIKISKDKTGVKFKRNKFIYEFLTSMRQKANDPLGQRAKKRKEINQR